MEYAMVDATIVTVHRHGQAVLNAGMMNDDTDKVTDCIPDDVACPLIFFPASNLCLPPASVVLTD